MNVCSADDAGDLSKMAWDIWMDYYPSVVRGDNIEYILNKFQSEEAIRQQMLDGCIYSYIMDGGVKAGYFCVIPQGDSLYISKFYVAKDHRGKGLGSRAMDEILEMGMKMRAKKAYLTVNKYNAASIDIYKHRGFIITGGDKIDIGDGFYMDDYQMEYYF